MAIESDTPLFVDLDGTLIRTDLLFESLLRLVRRNPLCLFLIPLWLLLGRIWLFARSGKLHEDPVLFAVEDRLSQLLVLAAGSLIWLAA